MTVLSCSCKRSGQRPHALREGNGQKERGWRSSLLGPPSPAPTITRVGLMTSASISGIHGRGNPYYLSSILGAFGLSPCPAASFRTKLFVSRFPLLLQQADPVFFPGLIVLMGNASPRAADTQQVALWGWCPSAPSPRPVVASKRRRRRADIWDRRRT